MTFFMAGCGWVWPFFGQVWVGVTLFGCVWVGVTFFLAGCGWVWPFFWLDVGKYGSVWVGVGKGMVYDDPSQIHHIKTVGPLLVGDFHLPFKLLFNLYWSMLLSISFYPFSCQWLSPEYYYHHLLALAVEVFLGLMLIVATPVLLLALLHTMRLIESFWFLSYFITSLFYLCC